MCLKAPLKKSRCAKHTEPSRSRVRNQRFESGFENPFLNPGVTKSGFGLSRYIFKVHHLKIKRIRIRYKNEPGFFYKKQIRILF